MKSRIGIIILTLVVVISAMVSANTRVSVRVTDVSASTINVNQLINGVVEPFRTTNLASKSGGVVEKVNIKVGQTIKQGDILIVFESDLAQAQVKQAEAALEMAKANLATAEKGASEEDILLVRASVDQAKASYEAAKRNLEVAETMFDDRTMQQQQLVGARLQVEIAEKQLKMVNEQFNQAEAAFKMVVADFERMSHLFENGVITKKQFEAIETQYQSSLSTYNSAQLGKAQAQISYDGAVESLQLVESMFNNRTTARQQVDGARTQLELAEVGLRVAETNLQKALKGATTEQILIARANVKQAEAALEMVKIQLSNTVITSPVSGVIAMVNVNPGEMTGPGVPIVSILELDQVYVKGDVTATVLRSIKLGDKASVKIRAFPESFRQGQIELISPTVDPRSQAFPVKILLDNPSHQLKPGMFADIHLTLEQAQNTTVVPVAAVLNLESTPHVFVVNNTRDGLRAERRNIRVGLVTDDKVEVLEGIYFGEQIVINGQHRLKDGDLVEVMR